MTFAVPTPSGRLLWKQSTVRGILANPVYRGTVSIGLTRPTPAHQRHLPLAPIRHQRGGYSRTDPQEWTAVAHASTVVSHECFD